MNRNGAATTSLLRQLEETETALKRRGPLRSSGDNGPMLADYAQRIEDGSKYAVAWRDAVHNGPDDTPPSWALDFKREWSDWGKDARKFDEIIRGILAMPPDELDVFLDGLFPAE